MTIHTFLVWAVWGSFFLLDRTWEEMIFATKSKGAYLHSSSWCDQEILCRKKAAEKGGKTCPLLLFSWTSPAPPPEPFQRRPPFFFLNCGCQPRGSYFRGCLSLLMRTQRPWRFRCIFLSLLGPPRPTRDRWISPWQGIPALEASHLLPACHRPSRWRLGAVCPKQKGYRLCDLSPEWQWPCQPGGGCRLGARGKWSSCSCRLRENQMHQYSGRAFRFARNVQTGCSCFAGFWYLRSVTQPVPVGGGIIWELWAPCAAY